MSALATQLELNLKLIEILGNNKMVLLQKR